MITATLLVLSFSVFDTHAYVPYNQKPEMCIDLSMYTLKCLDNNLHLLNTTIVTKRCNELAELFGFYCAVPRDVLSVSNQIDCFMSLSESINVWKQMITVHYLNQILQRHPKTKEYFYVLINKQCKLDYSSVTQTSQLHVIMVAPKFIPVGKKNMLKKQKALEVKRNMRLSLPVLNRHEIRRYRISHCQALLEELHEMGYMQSERFLRNLLEYQENLRKGQAPDSIICSRPQLIYSDNDLDILYNGFKIAEYAHFQDMIDREIDELIKLSVLYGFGSEDWWWLGGQILIHSVFTSKPYRKDDGKRKTIVNYLYGKFLLENMRKTDEALAYLNEARQEAMGRNWIVVQLGKSQDTIFAECSKLLYKILITDGKKVIESDPIRAYRLFIVAEKRAMEICDYQGQADAVLLQGLCKMDVGEANNAVTIFLKLISLCKRSRLKESMCEAFIQLAFAYVKIGRSEEALVQLEKLLMYAEHHALQHYVAQADRYIGEYYLNQGLPSTATPFLIKALQKFHELDDIPNREQVKNLAAISAGQELLPTYVGVVLKCNFQEGLPDLLKLTNWKDTRELFWTKSSSSLDFQSFFSKDSYMDTGVDREIEVEDEYMGEEEFGEYEEIVEQVIDLNSFQ